MIVETHCHIVASDQQTYPRNPIGQTDWVRDLDVETLAGLMDGAGVERAVLVQAFSAYQDDNAYVADSAARYPGRFTSVCIVNPMEPQAPDRLSYWVEQRGVRGLRIVTTFGSRLNLDEEPALKLFERAARLKIPVILLTQFRQVSRLRPALDRFPQLPIAVDHLGCYRGDARLSEGPPYPTAQPLFDLAAYPNFYLKFSSESIYQASQEASTPGKLFSLLVERFSSRRMLWGSNFPATHDRGYKEQLELAQKELSFLPEDDRAWIFGRTALALWPELA